MTERLPSDHDAVESHRVTLSTVGHTGRPELVLPAALDLAPDTVIRLSLEGAVAHAQIEETLRGEPAIRGAFDNRRLARTADAGEDRLGPWAEDAGLRSGDSVLLDVLTEGFAYGLRRPGRRVVYEAPDAPADSLSDIARDLGE